MALEFALLEGIGSQGGHCDDIDDLLHGGGACPPLLSFAGVLSQFRLSMPSRWQYGIYADA